MIRSAVVVAAMSAPPPARLPNSASDPAATMTTSRGQSGPQNAVTACAASFISAAMRASSGAVCCPAETDEVNRAAVAQASRWSTRRWAW